MANAPQPLGNVRELLSGSGAVLVGTQELFLRTLGGFAAPAERPADRDAHIVSVVVARIAVDMTTPRPSYRRLHAVRDAAWKPEPPNFREAFASFLAYSDGSMTLNQAFLSAMEAGSHGDLLALYSKEPGAPTLPVYMALHTDPGSAPFRAGAMGATPIPLTPSVKEKSPPAAAVGPETIPQGNAATIETTSAPVRKSAPPPGPPVAALEDLFAKARESFRADSTATAQVVGPAVSPLAPGVAAASSAGADAVSNESAAPASGAGEPSSAAKPGRPPPGPPLAAGVEGLFAKARASLASPADERSTSVAPAAAPVPPPSRNPSARTSPPPPRGTASPPPPRGGAAPALSVPIQAGPIQADPIQAAPTLATPTLATPALVIPESEQRSAAIEPPAELVVETRSVAPISVISETEPETTALNDSASIPPTPSTGSGSPLPSEPDSGSAAGGSAQSSSDSQPTRRNPFAVPRAPAPKGVVPPPRKASPPPPARAMEHLATPPQEPAPQAVVIPTVATSPAVVPPPVAVTQPVQPKSYLIPASTETTDAASRATVRPLSGGGSVLKQPNPFKVDDNARLEEADVMAFNTMVATAYATTPTAFSSAVPQRASDLFRLMREVAHGADFTALREAPPLQRIGLAARYILEPKAFDASWPFDDEERLRSLLTLDRAVADAAHRSHLFMSSAALHGMLFHANYKANRILNGDDVSKVRVFMPESAAAAVALDCVGRLVPLARAQALPQLAGRTPILTIGTLQDARDVPPTSQYLFGNTLRAMIVIQEHGIDRLAAAVASVARARPDTDMFKAQSAVFAGPKRDVALANMTRTVNPEQAAAALFDQARSALNLRDQTTAEPTVRGATPASLPRISSAAR